MMAQEGVKTQTGVNLLELADDIESDFGEFVLEKMQE